MIESNQDPKPPSQVLYQEYFGQAFNSEDPLAGGARKDWGSEKIRGIIDSLVSKPFRLLDPKRDLCTTENDIIKKTYMHDTGRALGAAALAATLLQMDDFFPKATDEEDTRELVDSALRAYPIELSSFQVPEQARPLHRLAASIAQLACDTLSEIEDCVRIRKRDRAAKALAGPGMVLSAVAAVATSPLGIAGWLTGRIQRYRGGADPLVILALPNIAAVQGVEKCKDRLDTPLVEFPEIGAEAKKIREALEGKFKNHPAVLKTD